MLLRSKNLRFAQGPPRPPQKSRWPTQPVWHSAWALATPMQMLRRRRALCQRRNPVAPAQQLHSQFRRARQALVAPEQHKSLTMARSHCSQEWLDAWAARWPLRPLLLRGAPRQLASPVTAQQDCSKAPCAWSNWLASARLLWTLLLRQAQGQSRSFAPALQNCLHAWPAWLDS